MVTIQTSATAARSSLAVSDSGSRSQDACIDPLASLSLTSPMQISIRPEKKLFYGRFIG